MKIHSNKLVSFRLYIIDLFLLLAFILICGIIDSTRESFMAPDSLGYVLPAKGLLAGKGFALLSEKNISTPCVHRTPLYSVYLAGFMSLFKQHGLLAAIWAQRILWAILVLTYAPFHKISSWKTSAILALTGKIIMLFSPQILNNFSLVQTDGLFTIFVFIALQHVIITIEKNSQISSLLSGLFFALLMLTRVVGLLLPFILSFSIFFLIFRKNAVRRRTIIRLFIPVMLIPLSAAMAWSFRNWLVSGHFGFSPLSGYNLALHNMEVIQELHNVDAFAHNTPEQTFAKVLSETDSIPEALTTVQKQYQLDEFEANDVAFRVAKSAVWHAPFRYLMRSIFYGLRLFLAPADATTLLVDVFGRKPLFLTPFMTALTQRDWGGILLHLIIRLVNFVFLLVVPIGIFFVDARKNNLYEALVVMGTNAVYFTIFTAFIIPTYGRFLLPIYPSLLFLYTRKFKSSHAKLVAFI